ncbi:MAG: NrfD/PsrC family molybdoenzyme membrane anchor subunit [Dehalococcoidia bacterium]|nr:NrfD/PsrC family molybdoenzyme membrane anchor subunit [Dehalococcoidia bacterium]
MRSRAIESFQDRLERVSLAPLIHTQKTYYLFVFLLLATVAWGLYAYAIQLRYGLVTTGLGDQVMYGVYIVNFVFFIGISYAGALVSAILRLTNAGWRSPITRISEIIAVGGLTDGALQPIIDLGHPERAWHIIAYGRFQSPLLWDIIAITTYLVGSLLYLYLPLIPDLALARDRLGQSASGFKRKIFTVFAVGWQDTPDQRKRLNRAIGIMAIMIIPLAVSVHTVVAFIFSMTLRPGWNSTIYGVYFVIGAVFSGTAVLLIVIAIFRKVYHFEEYIKEKHFRNLGYMLLALLLLYLYLTFTEYLTGGYKMEEGEEQLLTLVMLGKNAPWFWFFVIAGMIVPAFLLIFSKLKTIPMVLIAAVLVVLGMWVKRYIIIVPTLEVPLMPFEFGSYSPTWVEISIGLATLAGFSVMVTLAAKFMPLVSVWELKEEAEKETHHKEEAEGQR